MELINKIVSQKDDSPNKDYELAVLDPNQCKHDLTEEEHDHEKALETDHKLVKPDTKDAKKECKCCIDMAPIVLLFSLSFHSFFEGIAVGLLKDMPTLINLIIGICVH
jgi:zinc transporter ZupT